MSRAPLSAWTCTSIATKLATSSVCRSVHASRFLGGYRVFRPEARPHAQGQHEHARRVHLVVAERNDGGAGIQSPRRSGVNPISTDLLERHPFDVEILRVSPGRLPYPYHAHAAQWEFYHVISGTGSVRHAGGTTPIEPGDAFIFLPGEPHQIINDGAIDLVVYVIADNPFNEARYFPDSDKLRPAAGTPMVRATPKLEYMDGEE